MRRLRVLMLMHEELLPPETIEGLSDEEIRPWKMEYDVRWALRDELHHEVQVLGVENDLRPIRQALQDWRPHIAFNLLRQFHGVAGYDAHVVSYLELMKTAYTGANPRGLLITADKALSKKILAWHRIPVPAFLVAKKGRKVRSVGKLTFPMFVKSVAEHASLGISQASVVHDFAALTERVRFIHESIGTDALVEEYIDGRELNVGILGNERLMTFPVWEMRFTNLQRGAEAIATRRVKEDYAYQRKIGLETGPAEDLAEDAAARIQRIARRTYQALELNGFARIDFRMDAEGRVFVLEANPNCDLCWGEDFSAAAEKVGLTYPQMVQRIVSLGLRYQPGWKQE